MADRRIQSEDLVRVFETHKIATMDLLKRELKTSAERTLYRRLKEVTYQTSYTHGGAYFTLDRISRFNDDGLWCYKSVCFSQHGTLQATLETWVNSSHKGFYVAELQVALNASVKETLLRLFKRGRLSRQKIEGRYLYCSAKTGERNSQIRARRAELAAKTPDDELLAGILLFFTLLDEQQRRLFAGLESIRHGMGDDRRIAELLGVSSQTVAKGRQQLLDRDVEMHRTRKAGGGRKPIKKSPRHPPTDQSTDAIRDGGRPDDGIAMDEEDAGKDLR